MNLCKNNLFRNEEFPQINEKTSWKRLLTCSQLDTSTEAAWDFMNP
jgi:hypothetical protein